MWCQEWKWKKTHSRLGEGVSLLVWPHLSWPLACDCPAMASMMASCEYMLIGVLYWAWTMVAFPPGPLTSMGLWVDRAESFRAMGLKLGVYSTLSVRRRGSLVGELKRRFKVPGWKSEVNRWVRERRIWKERNKESIKVRGKVWFNYSTATDRCYTPSNSARSVSPSIFKLEQGLHTQWLAAKHLFCVTASEYIHTFTGGKLYWNPHRVPVTTC